MQNATNGNQNGQPIIVRTERGLTVAGTRITLYAILDFIKENYPLPLIQHKFLLTEQQMTAVLAYLNEHRDEVEIEYQQVLKQAEELRRYHEEKLREHLATQSASPLQTDVATIRAKLMERKARLRQP